MTQTTWACHVGGRARSPLGAYLATRAQVICLTRSIPWITTAGMPSTTTVEFTHPPVVEVAIGVEFQPISGWGIAHFGLFWDEIRSTYPRCVPKPPLASQIELFGSPQRRPEITWQFVDSLNLRCWFEHADNCHLLQVQENRFILNWKLGDPSAHYPKYENLRREFKLAWGGFSSFLVKNQLAVPTIVQCDLTYVDLFRPGAVWKKASEIGRLTPMLGAFQNPVGELEAVTTSARFLLPEQRGRVHAVLQPAIQPDGQEVMKLDVTARGAPESPSFGSALEWLDYGHDVAAFWSSPMSFGPFPTQSFLPVQFEWKTAHSPEESSLPAGSLSLERLFRLLHG